MLPSSRSRMTSARPEMIALSKCNSNGRSTSQTRSRSSEYSSMYRSTRRRALALSRRWAGLLANGTKEVFVEHLLQFARRRNSSTFLIVLRDTP